MILPKKTAKVNKMTDENKYITIEAKGFTDLCNRIKQLEEENKFLQAKLEQKQRMLKGVKLNNGKLTIERNKLLEELVEIKKLSMFEFGNRYCSSESLEEDGHAFARALLGGK